MVTLIPVDRSSGVIIHPYVGNSGFPEREVLAPGSRDWGFEVMAYKGVDPKRWASYFAVQEFAEGPDKPLLAIANGISCGGVCR